MQLTHKFYAGFHHFILSADVESPMQWGRKIGMLINEGHDVHFEKHTHWVSFETELDAIEFKLRYADV